MQKSTENDTSNFPSHYVDSFFAHGFLKIAGKNCSFLLNKSNVQSMEIFTHPLLMVRTVMA
ncbi:hypothetical protein J32TS6_07030 [Virgibacillus pantothenticus]|nr:hypothetical protein J32TS6_07030 [Virgibacillus pantothenticus]